MNNKKIIGKKWNELTEVEQKELLSKANAIDGATGNDIDKFYYSHKTKPN